MSAELGLNEKITGEGAGWEELSEASTSPEIHVDQEALSTEDLSQERHRLQKKFYQELMDRAKQENFNTYVETLKELHAEDPEILLPRTEDYREETISFYETFLTANKKLADFKTRGMSQEERAQAEGMYDSNDHTVEVQSAVLYEKRLGALQARLASEELTDEERTKSRETLNATRGLFKRHLDLKRTPQPAGIMEVREYQIERANSHNNLIQNLNSINEMCEKYDVERLTYRNFLTNNPYSTRDIDPQLINRQEEDRAIVEQYFSVAFGEHSLDKSFDSFGRGGGRDTKDGGKTNLFDDLYIDPGEADDKEWVRMRKLEHMAKKRGEKAKKAGDNREKAA